MHGWSLVNIIFNFFCTMTMTRNGSHVMDTREGMMKHRTGYWRCLRMQVSFVDYM